VSEKKKELNTYGSDAMQMLGAALAATMTVPPLQGRELFFHKEKAGLIPRQDEKDDRTRNISTTTTNCVVQYCAETESALEYQYPHQGSLMS
jgi:hypothetical protein